MTRKAHYDLNGSRTIEMQWRNLSSHSDPNDLCKKRKNLFVSFMDKHAPVKSKRIRNKCSPWITSELLLKMR